MQDICDDLALHQYAIEATYKEIHQISLDLKKKLPQYTHYASQVLPAARACHAIIIDKKTAVYLSLAPGQGKTYVNLQIYIELEKKGKKVAYVVLNETLKVCLLALAQAIPIPGFVCLTPDGIPRHQIMEPECVYISDEWFHQAKAWLIQMTPDQSKMVGLLSLGVSE